MNLLKISDLLDIASWKKQTTSLSPKRGVESYFNSKAHSPDLELRSPLVLKFVYYCKRLIPHEVSQSDTQSMLFTGTLKLGFLLGALGATKRHK